MSSTTVRETALDALAVAQPVAPLDAPEPGKSLASGYGRDVFNARVMRQRLPRDVYDRLMQTMTRRAPLDPADADVIAGAMKDWALEHGATHYTHWFQPMTGLTAEKHDAFLSPTPDGQVFGEFSGKMLIKGEPDASSFPSGGIRSTFEARGYTAWDPTSPVFLLGDDHGRKTLYIPTVFYSYTGEALDRKTPLMRSVEAVSAQALRILRLLGNTTATSVQAMVGSEQEYFLVDRRLYIQRPDLMMCGRTLYGARPAKGQEMEDHYFGSIPSRVLAYMQDVEQRLFALGIPAHTRHNEVAPGQFEIAPVYEDVNIATDHNMLTMEVMRRTARRHGYVCLLHEKPFAGVNGSGKHNNWSLCDSDGHNLLNPGETPMKNAQFLVFLAAVLRAVHKHGVNLRLGIIGASNDHRLGANEAPPAVLSVYLGESLSGVIRSIAYGKEAEGGGVAPIEIGVSVLPEIPRDLSDRNRTSPFAFTGNKFEFRALGSSQNIAAANISLNAAMACALDDIAAMLEAELAEGTPLNGAIQGLLAKLFAEHMPIVFDGNGYSEEWLAEAERRGLPNLRDTVAALAHYGDKDVMDVFDRHNVLSPREMLSRQEILLESYTHTIAIEGHTALKLGRTRILPVALAYQTRLADAASAAASLAGDAEPEKAYFLRVRGHVRGLIAALDALEAVLDARFGDTALAKAEYARDRVLPAMNACRGHADALECLCANHDWPLPSYAELLWLH